MELAQSTTAPSSLGSNLDDWLAHVAGRVRAKTWQGYECLVRIYARPHLGNVLPLVVALGATAVSAKALRNQAAR